MQDDTLSYREEAPMGHHQLLPPSREDFQLWNRIGDVYWRESSPAEARRAWERARSLKPGNPVIKHKLTALAAGADPLKRPA